MSQRIHRTSGATLRPFPGRSDVATDHDQPRDFIHSRYGLAHDLFRMMPENPLAHKLKGV